MMTSIARLNRSLDRSIAIEPHSLAIAGAPALPRNCAHLKVQLHLLERRRDLALEHPHPFAASGVLLFDDCGDPGQFGNVIRGFQPIGSAVVDGPLPVTGRGGRAAVGVRTHDRLAGAGHIHDSVLCPGGMGCRPRLHHRNVAG